ncbi:vWA domain-containing protein [Phreatobacter cathodiphilus]|uniref:VWA domain-containing protein n=1 Tax=Phreatobacter cathodiphilus TaxID=1868589 RepID=A0A2S0NB61_9HYPH|nr:VWA domain-containing protein [Phreatobacter cathodiphilus]AVO45392.1 VWA domain-containing protein [Phreatobacter cathodiphilus]
MANALAENITHFARALRTAGLPVGPGTVLDAVQAVEAAGIGSREDFYWTLHAVFVTKHEQSVLFRTAFEIFWKKRHLMEKLLSILMPVAPATPGKPDPVSLRLQEAFFKQAESVPVEKPEIEVDASLTVSDIEVLQKKDFAQMTAAEIAEASRRVAALVLPDDAVPTRRLAPDPRGRRIDLRRTLRRSIGEGGGIIDLARRGPKTKHPPLVVLCDISGSMNQYTRVILHFVHALMENRRNVHAFTFGTRLTNITRMLKARDPDEALAACTAAVEDWSGGTRIAPSLAAFNRLWSRRVLSGGAVVLLVTDGLERDGTADLARAADRLHRSCRRLVWLNPLLRFDGFEARAQGIRALLPHVDEFRTIHNVAAVADLVAALDARRTDRAHDPRRWMKAL